MVRELLGIVLFALAVFLGGALMFENLSPDGGCTAASGPFGPIGGCSKWIMLSLVGLAGAGIVPLIPLVHAMRLFGKVEARTDRSWLVFTTGLALLAPIAAALARHVVPSGGTLDPVAGL